MTHKSVITNNTFRILTIFIISLAVISSGWFAYRHFTASPIKDFNYERDAAFVKSAFDKDIFWLSDTPNYNVDRVIKDLNPSQTNDINKGDLKIKILFDKNKQAGFVAYYKQSLAWGYLLFLWVDPTYRGKNYGEKLLTYAFNEMFKSGNSRVRLVTRIANKPARRIYEHVGMRAWKEEDPFIYYAIDKK